ncbi:CDP-alcohol phosphatidyltransferase family protein [Gemmatimonas sp.]|uniref:CDP-alcohol phosphatidyltransferase family protein n=1 Tax=Gemmatimonas sp. TaxID=1962908 RepID=UPI00334164B3
MTATKLIAIRTVLALAAAAVYLISPFAALFGISMLAVASLIDWADGVFAEKNKHAKPFGGFLDISADQCIEYVFWGVFIYLHLVPLWIPMFIVVRNSVINLLRVSAIRNGASMFGSGGMVRSGLGRRLVASRLSRGSMVLAKGIGFILITFAYYFSNDPAGQRMVANPNPIRIAGTACLVLLAIIHFVRGALIIADSRELFADFLWSERQAKDAYRPS